VKNDTGDRCLNRMGEVECNKQARPVEALFDQRSGELDPQRSRATDQRCQPPLR
jgi:hypothetical protein